MMNNKLLKEKLDKYFKKTKEQDIDLIMKLFKVFAYNENTDLFMLAELLSLEDLVKLSDFYNGDVLLTPTKDLVEKVFTASIVFYFKEFKGISAFDEIEDILGIQLNRRKVGRCYNEKKEKMFQDLRKILDSESQK